jgi:hypothetical protein
MIHEEYAGRVMGVSISLFDRIYTGVKAVVNQRK